MNFYSPLEQFEFLPISGVFSGYDLLEFIFDVELKNGVGVIFTTFHVTGYMGFIIICCGVGLVNISRLFGGESGILDNLHYKVVGLGRSFITAVRGVGVGTNGVGGSWHLGIVLVIGLYVLVYNVLGLVPFGFCNTAQISLTQTLGGLVICGLTIRGLVNLKVWWFRIFVPRNVKGVLVIMLIGIEVVSYCFRMISMAVRLFANMVAGHVLLHIFVGALVLGFSKIGEKLAVLLLLIIPASIIVSVMLLETVVAFLQCYVFIVLYSIYVNDTLHLH